MKFLPGLSKYLQGARPCQPQGSLFPTLLDFYLSFPLPAFQAEFHIPRISTSSYCVPNTGCWGPAVNKGGHLLSQSWHSRGRVRT